jgi:hypothetical protein
VVLFVSMFSVLLNVRTNLVMFMYLHIYLHVVQVIQSVGQRKLQQNASLVRAGDAWPCDAARVRRDADGGERPLCMY